MPVQTMGASLRKLRYWANNIGSTLFDVLPPHVPVRRGYPTKTGPRSRHQAERQRRIKQATPRWFNRKEVERLYLHAQRLTQRRKEKYHVDHIIPIWHPKVCGLHTYENMRVVTQRQNVTKNNRFSIRWQSDR